jgi:hypothetical protein
MTKLLKATNSSFCLRDPEWKKYKHYATEKDLC